MIRIGLVFSNKKNWTGGSIYLENFSSIIKTHLNNKISLILISNQQNYKNTDKSIISNFINIFYSFKINNILNKNQCNLIFETNEFLGFFIKKKTITWIPDFQHKYYPNYFSYFSYLKRDISIWFKIKLRNKILVSSLAAKKDCLKFYKVKSNKVSVVPFATNIFSKNLFNRYLYLKKKYNIKPNFFFIPNQFWQHKNHNLIFNFLDKIYKDKKKFKKLPQFVFTGLASDFRNENYAKDLKKKINSNKYSAKIKYLGVVPYRDVCILNANSLALVNPSFFEGWSTTVEEAKSLGTRMILSNIKTHKEQAPNALFFNPYKINEFEKCIMKCIKNKKNKKNLNKIKKNSEIRKNKFAEAVLKTFR